MGRLQDPDNDHLVQLGSRGGIRFFRAKDAADQLRKHLVWISSIFFSRVEKIGHIPNGRTFSQLQSWQNIPPKREAIGNSSGGPTRLKLLMIS